MEKFVLAGKAKTVFQIIELMAKGEESKKKDKVDNSKLKLTLDNSYQLWPSSN
ncbi:hypothetical protein ACFLUP_00420 [Chloroflexota bacterium]